MNQHLNTLEAIAEITEMQEHEGVDVGSKLKRQHDILTT